MAGTMEERSGWVLYAVSVFIILGVFNVIYGLTMLLNDEWLVFGADTVWYVNLATWGWITLIIGLLQFLVAWGISDAALWARIVGVVAAGLALVGAFVTIPIYPWWSITVMVLAGLVIWAITAHGDEVHETHAAGTA